MNISSKEKMLIALTVLEDAIVDSAITKHPDLKCMIKTRNFLMERGKVTEGDLSRFQLGLLEETSKIF